MLFGVDLGKVIPAAEVTLWHYFGVDVGHNVLMPRTCQVEVVEHRGENCR